MDDPVLLSRIQFAITVGFHFLFPPISIGLAWLLVFIEHRAWRTGDPVWERMGRFYGKLFGLTFAIGVATGIVMEFQFGSNWAAYSRYVGDVFGSMLAAEGMFAFFLESGFLGLYLLGRNRLPRGLHWFSILMVATGATISAFWILVANSWQQTPAGHVIVNGRAELASFFDAVFNPSTLPRFNHTMAAALVAGSFFMGGVAAFMLIRGKATDVARRALVVALAVGAISSVLAAFPTGHEHAQQVARTQPEKFAAIEGLYETEKGAPLVFFALQKADPPRLEAAIRIPKVLSWLAFGDPDAEIHGIDKFRHEDLPPLWLPFVSFHNMVLLGLLFQGVAFLGLLLHWRGKLHTSRRFWWLMLATSPLPLVAIQFGWVAAEVGRQPWVVYRLLRTSDAVSATVTAGEVWTSMIAFGLVYLVLLAIYLGVIWHKASKGPDDLPAGKADVAGPAAAEVR
ncbi:MAG: cytochrome ubiquinol oxidase subunit I [Deltaproteobacteria bacterium]|nr:cytochrome ubiquinol oxidase subunit I [Deltaproteobacteria bacterium]